MRIILVNSENSPLPISLWVKRLYMEWRLEVLLSLGNPRLSISKDLMRTSLNLCIDQLCFKSGGRLLVLLKVFQEGKAHSSYDEGFWSQLDFKCCREELMIEDTGKLAGCPQHRASTRLD